MLRYWILISFVLLALGGCSDWHLRGARPDAVPVETAYLSVPGAPRMGQALRRELYYSGVALVPKNKAQVTLEVREEKFDRRVLSVDPDNGKVREVELELQVTFSARSKDGKLILPAEKLSWVQDYIFDESSLLGTTEQAATIRNELAVDAARTVLLRLETIEPDAL